MYICLQHAEANEIDTANFNDLHRYPSVCICIFVHKQQLTFFARLRWIFPEIIGLALKQNLLKLVIIGPNSDISPIFLSYFNFTVRHICSVVLNSAQKQIQIIWKSVHIKHWVLYIQSNFSRKHSKTRFPYIYGSDGSYHALDSNAIWYERYEC